MRRFPELAASDLDADQRRMAQAASHGGPYGAFLRAPVLWEQLQPLRRYLATDSALNAATREAVVLMLARHWNASAMFAGHEALALRAGLTPSQIDAIGRGAPVDLADPTADMALRCCAALLADHGLPDALFARACGVLGERGIVELVGLIGFFSTIGLTLNLAGIGGDAPFPTAMGACSPADESTTGKSHSAASF